MKKVQLYPTSLAEFLGYLNKCIHNLFIIDSIVFTDLLHFHLQQIKHKLHVKALDFQYKGRKSVTLRLDYAEQITLSYMFKHVEIDATMATMLGIQYQVLDGLTIGDIKRV
jgi:hypothetical protein